MSKSRDFRPDWVSAPGDTIREILRDRQIAEIEFAKKIGCTRDSARALLDGRAAITLTIARGLEDALGASVEFWMSRDFQYRQEFAQRRESEETWIASLPLDDMIRFGWIASVPHPADEAAVCLRFFDVPSVAAWAKSYANLNQMAMFRTSLSLDSRLPAVAAWLRQGEIAANSMACKPWNKKLFQECLVKARWLTREKNPARFIPQLQRLCADCGVAVVIVRAPSGCRASGATRFLSKDKAVLQLSFRYLSDDQFWFTFFHEAGHLVLHGVRGFFLEGVETNYPEQEEEANKFAEETLIPPEFRTFFSELSRDPRQVIRFALRLGIAPGIVVGQMQHLGRIRPNQLNSLKRRFEWEG